MKKPLAVSSLKKITLILASVFVLLIAVLTAIWVWPHNEQSYESTTYAMGSYIQQTLYGKNAQETAAKASQAITGLENHISWRIAGSDIEKLNSSAGSKWISISPDTAAVLQKSLDVAKNSNGAFDPTVLPLSSLWNFDSDHPTVPQKGEIQKLLPYISYKNLRVNTKENTASLKFHGDGVDLGGVGKGAACETALDVYRLSDIKSGIVAVGGSIGVYGTKPDHSPWCIAVRNPFGNRSDGIATLNISKGYVSTSGSYEKSFTRNGVFYHHLLNPKTGYPDKTDLISVTIVHKSGAVSDALATACFVLGIDKSLPLLKQMDAQALFIDKDKHITVTNGLYSSFTLTNKSYTVKQINLP